MSAQTLLKGVSNTPAFYVDHRSLVFFRICICFWVFRDLFCRWYYNSIEPFLTDDGVLMDMDMNYHKMDNILTSILFYRGSINDQYIFFIIHIINTTFLLFGYHVTLTSILNYLLIYGLHSRNYHILNGGDLFFRCLSFMFIFSSKFSLSNSIAKKHKNYISGVNIILLLLQCWIIYPMCVIHRFYNYEVGTWLPYNNGDNTCTSVYLAMLDFRLSTRIGHFVGTLPSYILYVLCISTNILEFVAPTILLFTSNDIVRYICLILLFFMQITFNVTLRLGPFLYSTIIALVPFIPGSFWDHCNIIINSTKLSVNYNLLFVYDKNNKCVKISLLNKILSTFFCVYLIFQNMSHSRVLGLFELFDNRLIEKHLGIDQRWYMFGPDVASNTYYDVLYVDINGTKLDLIKLMQTGWNNTDFIYLNDDEFIIPYRPTPSYHINYIRWAKFLSSLHRNKIQRQTSANYFCSQYYQYYDQQQNIYINNQTSNHIFNLSNVAINQSYQTKIGFCIYGARKINMYHRHEIWDNKNQSIWDETTNTYNWEYFFDNSKLTCSDEWVFNCSKYIINYEYYNYYQYFNHQIVEIFDQNDENQVLYLPFYWSHYLIKIRNNISNWFQTRTEIQSIQARQYLYKIQLPIAKRSHHMLFIGDINEIFYFVQNLFENWCKYLLTETKYTKSICHSKYDYRYLTRLLSNISPILNDLTFDNFEWISIVIDIRNIFKCVQTKIEYENMNQFKFVNNMCYDIQYHNNFQQKWDYSIYKIIYYLRQFNNVEIAEINLIQYIETSLIEYFGDSNIIPIISSLMLL